MSETTTAGRRREPYHGPDRRAADRRRAARRATDAEARLSAALRRTIRRSAVVLGLLLFLGGSTADVRSCVRQGAPRKALRAIAPNMRQEAAYWRQHGRAELAVILDRRAARLGAVKVPDCYRFPPGE